MGIEDINSTLNDIIKDIIKISNSNGNNISEIGFYKNLEVSKISGKKIAVDVSILMNAKFITEHNEIVFKSLDLSDVYNYDILQRKVFKSIISFIINLISEGVTPIIIFDGEIHPMKLNTIIERSNTKKAKLQKASDYLNYYRNVSPFDRTEIMINQVKENLKNAIRIRKEDYSELKNLLEYLGIPCFTAENDAEKLCSSLAIEGTVDFVYSTDTDNYPLGTPFLITSIFYNNSSTYGGKNGLLFNCAVLNELIGCLNLHCSWTDRQFSMDNLIDLCILHGCDYNVRMQIPTKNGNKLKSVGPKTALNYIKEYGNFENFHPNMYPFMSCLNIEECRKIFTYSNSNISINDCLLDWEKMCMNINEIFSRYEIERYITMAFNQIQVSKLHIKRDFDNFTELNNFNENKDNNLNEKYIDNDNYIF